MTWQPNYKRDLRKRLRRAAEWVREHPNSRWHLALAVKDIVVFKADEFPADFRSQWQEIIAIAAGSDTTIDAGVAALNEDEAQALRRRIVALYVATCEPPEEYWSIPF